MVDCPTEDVPFREGTFGGARSVVPIPTPGFPFLALISAPSGSHLLSFSKNKTGSPLLLRGSRLRYWLCPLLSAHLYESELLSLYFGVFRSPSAHSSKRVSRVKIIPTDA
jgi:hypothetical protein